MGFLEGDQSAGKLKKREVVLGFLRPADQERPVAVEPGVAGLDDPAAGSPAGVRSFELEFVTTATDVRGVAAVGREVVDPGIGVAAVEAQTLRLLRRRLWPRDRNRVEGRG